MSGQPRELAVFEPGNDGRSIIGRVAAKGLADELHDRGYLVIDGVDGKAHNVALNARDELANYPTGAVVEVKGSADVRAADITTWLSNRAGPSQDATRRRLSPPTSGGWKRCAGPVSWSAWPKGYGRCQTTWPSVAASTTRNGWAAWPWN
jgi:Protein of unknown function (DUF3363)